MWEDVIGENIEFMRGDLNGEISLLSAESGLGLIVEYRISVHSTLLRPAGALMRDQEITVMF